MLILSLVFVTTCNQNNNTLYCEQNSDCTFQEDSCCGHPVNKLNYKILSNDELNPKCHTQCVPESLKKSYCNELNECNTKIQCEDCSSILTLMEQIGCNDEFIPAQSINACQTLSSCNCV